MGGEAYHQVTKAGGFAPPDSFMAKTGTEMPERLLDVAVDTDTGTAIVIFDLGEGDRLLLSLGANVATALRDQLMAKILPKGLRQ